MGGATRKRGRPPTRDVQHNPHAPELVPDLQAGVARDGTRQRVLERRDRGGVHPFEGVAERLDDLTFAHGTDEPQRRRGHGFVLRRGHLQVAALLQNHLGQRVASLRLFPVLGRQEGGRGEAEGDEVDVDLHHHEVLSPHADGSQRQLVRVEEARRFLRETLRRATREQGTRGLDAFKGFGIDQKRRICTLASNGVAQFVCTAHPATRGTDTVAARTNPRRKNISKDPKSAEDSPHFFFFLDPLSRC